MSNKTGAKKGQGTPKKMGRPTKYDPEVANAICRYIEDGESIRYIAEQRGMPSRDTIRRWLVDNEDFQAQYIRAKDHQAELYAETINDIAKGTLNGQYDPNAARVAIDAYKWTASKLKPKKYGDKIDHTSDGKALPAPIILVNNAPKPDSDVKRDVIDAEIVDKVSQIPGPVQNGNLLDDING